MTLKDLEPQLLALPPDEKARAIQLLIQSLRCRWQGIEKSPEVCGGEACIAGTHLPVWSLVKARRSGASDARILAAMPYLTAADLMNAWAYADAHLEEIEAAIQVNGDLVQGLVANG